MSCQSWHHNRIGRTLYHFASEVYWPGAGGQVELRILLSDSVCSPLGCVSDVRKLVCDNLQGCKYVPLAVYLLMQDGIDQCVVKGQSAVNSGESASGKVSERLYIIGSSHDNVYG